MSSLISLPHISSLQLDRPTKQMREAEERLKAIPQFCFPDAKDCSSARVQQVEARPGRISSTLS